MVYTSSSHGPTEAGSGGQRKGVDFQLKDKDFKCLLEILMGIISVFGYFLMNVNKTKEFFWSVSLTVIQLDHVTCRCLCEAGVKFKASVNCTQTSCLSPIEQKKPKMKKKENANWKNKWGYFVGYYLYLIKFIAFVITWIILEIT